MYFTCVVTTQGFIMIDTVDLSYYFGVTNWGCMSLMYIKVVVAQQITLDCYAL
jgi:hypothetical protein